MTRRQNNVAQRDSRHPASDTQQRDTTAWELVNVVQVTFDNYSRTRTATGVAAVACDRSKATAQRATSSEDNRQQKRISRKGLPRHQLTPYGEDRRELANQGTKYEICRAPNAFQ